MRTTGWVVVRFVPRPTGIRWVALHRAVRELMSRWLLSAHPLPPLLILPPLSLTLALSSSLVAFSIISYIFRGRPLPPPATSITSEGTSEELLLAEKRRATFETRDKEEKTEAERRRREWEEVESSALGGLQRMPADKKRGESTIGGVSAARFSFALALIISLRLLHLLLSAVSLECPSGPSTRAVPPERRRRLRP